MLTGKDDGRTYNAGAQNTGDAHLTRVMNSDCERTAVHVLAVVQDHYFPVTCTSITVRLL